MHQHLGHLHSAALRRFCSTHQLSKTCTSCILAKSHRRPFSSKFPISSRILFHVHSDVVGPMQSLTCSGKKYFVTFIDEASRYNRVFLISKKSEVFDCFRHYLTSAKRYTGQNLCILKSDRGGEYRSARFMAFAASRGIILEQGPANTPQHNGLAERFNRTILERVRAQMIHANIPKKLWGEVVSATSHVLNLSPSSVVPDSPHDLWHNASAEGGIHKSDISFLRVIGCAGYVHTHGVNRRKLDDTLKRMVLVGYEHGAKAYRLYDLDSHRITVACDVTFLETVFPLRHQQSYISHTDPDLSLDDFWFPTPDDLLHSPAVPRSPSSSLPSDNNTDSPIRAPTLRPLQLRPAGSKVPIQRLGNLQSYAARAS